MVGHAVRAILNGRVSVSCRGRGTRPYLLIEHRPSGLFYGVLSTICSLSGVVQEWTDWAACLT